MILLGTEDLVISSTLCSVSRVGALCRATDSAWCRCEHCGGERYHAAEPGLAAVPGRDQSRGVLSDPRHIA